MKSLKLLNIVMLCMAIALVSCAGEDGAQGIPGTNGVDGTDGANGTNGVDGADGLDGNANVSYMDYDLSGFSGTSYFVDTELTTEEVNSSAFYFYLKGKSSITMFTVPGKIDPSNTLYATVEIAFITGNIFFSFFNRSDDSVYNVPLDTYDFLRVVRLELDNSGKNGQASLNARLKKAGVDTSDYYSIAEYFGIED